MGEESSGFSELSALAEQVSQIVECIDRMRGPGQGGSVGLLGLGFAAEGCQCLGEARVGCGKLGPEPNRTAAGVRGLFVAAERS